MIVELLLLIIIVLLFISSGFGTREKTSAEPFVYKYDYKIKYLESVLFQILLQIGEFLEIKIIPTSDYSHVENKKYIYLLLVDSSGNLYPDDVLIEVMLHELAHILSPDDRHDFKFYSIYDHLVDVTEELGYTITKSEDYPCKL